MWSGDNVEDFERNYSLPLNIFYYHKTWRSFFLFPSRGIKLFPPFQHDKRELFHFRMVRQRQITWLPGGMLRQKAWEPYETWNACFLRERKSLLCSLSIISSENFSFIFLSLFITCNFFFLKVHAHYGHFSILDTGSFGFCPDYCRLHSDTRLTWGLYEPER